MKKKLEDVLGLSVTHHLILSDRGDLSAVFRARYPELFSRSKAEYIAMHGARVRALQVLSDRTVYLQQDGYRNRYVSATAAADDSFLERAGQRFFRGRPYLEHSCHITITRLAETRRTTTSLVSSLITGRLVPPQAVRPEVLERFEGELGQFARLMHEAGIPLERLRDEDILSSRQRAGWLERYILQLPASASPLLRDLNLSGPFHPGTAGGLLFTLADAESFPAHCSPWQTHRGYSTEETDFPVGFAASAGPLMRVTHLYSQFILLEDAGAARRRLERKNKRLYSLARYSRENAVAQSAVSNYLNEMLRESRRPCRLHCNLLVFPGEAGAGLSPAEHASAAFARMEASCKQETLSAPQLFWAGIPGNAAELPVDHTIQTFTEQAACFLNADGLPADNATGIRFAERLSGRPLRVDLFDAPLAHGMISNRNLFIAGGSGGGKSMTMNHLVRSLYDEGAHSVIIDIGDSYRGLAELTGGYHFSYTEQDPICFNPFYLPEGGHPDTEKKEALKALLAALWKQEHERLKRSEYVALSNALKGYYEMCSRCSKLFTCFDTFYEYLQTGYRVQLAAQNVQPADFDLANFLYVLRPYYRGGEFDYLLNAEDNLDMLGQRFIVFELDNIKDHPILFPVVTLVIMELFISKMRHLPDTRKILVIEEAWKAIARTGMAEFIRYAFKTVRKFNGIAAVVTQEIDDLVTSPIVKEAIINNADIKILTDMRKFIHKFDALERALGLSEKAKTILLSVNRDNEPGKHYREVFIDLGGQLTRVYRNELSPEEYYAYTTEAPEKLKVQRYALEEGSLEAGIRRLVEEEASGRQPCHR